MKKILVIGKTGQVAANLAEQIKTPYQSLGRAELDLSQPTKVYNILQSLPKPPQIIINAAAYTAVDAAEDEKGICNNINHLSVGEIARFCRDTKALLVHYSTDYVFDGLGNAEYLESNTENLHPVNYYGTSKLAGERAIQNSGCDYLIFRTSWVYNHSGKNFVKTILRLAAEKQEIKIVADQIGSPTYSADIATATLKILAGENIKGGIYNLIPSEQISWHGFAELIVKQAAELGFPTITKKMIPIKTTEYPTKAARPHNSRLSNHKLQNNFSITLPAIAESLGACLVRMHSL